MPQNISTADSDETEESTARPKAAEKKRSWLKILFLALGAGLLLVVGAVAFLLLRPTALDLSRFGPAIDEQMTAALGREISIDGAIVLVTGIVPSVRLEKVTMGNPADWEKEGNFASLESIETSVGLGELLEQKINIDDIHVKGLSLDLVRDASGRGNWEGFAALEDTGDDAADDSDEDTASPPEAAEGFDLEFTELGGIVIENLQVSYRTADTEAAEAEQFQLDRLQGSAKLGEGLLLSLSGTFLDLPLSGDLKGGTLAGLRSRVDEWPVDLNARLGASALHFDGNLSTVDFKAPGVLNFDLDIPRPQQLVPLIGELPDFGSLQLSGQAMRSSTDQYSVSDLEGRLGSAEVTGTLALNVSGLEPDLEGQLKIGSIDLASFRPDAEDGEAPASADPSSPSSSLQEVASVPFGENLLPFTGRFNIVIDELVGAVSGLEIDDLSLELLLAQHDGSAELDLMVGDVPLHGRLELTRLSEEVIDFDLDLNSTDADFTDIVAYYTGTDRFQGSVRHLQYQIEGNGKTLKEAWDSREVHLEVDDAKMIFHSEDEAHHFFLEEGVFSGKHGQPGESHIVGTLRNAPFDLELGFDAADTDDAGLARVYQIDGKIADAEVSIRNLLKERPELGDAQFEFSVEGGSLDKLDSIYELNLPPLGPYSGSGIFVRKGKLLEFRDVSMMIGSTQLSGSYSREGGDGKPRVALDLKSPSLQLDDFLFDQWSPVNAEQAKQADGDSALNDLLGYEALNEFDGTIKLDLGEVNSGKDRLGSGSLSATIENGQLVVTPLELGIPGGSLKGGFRFHPKADRTVDWSLQLSAQRFEVGVLVRRADPDSDFSAIANADLDLSANGVPYDIPRLKNASGSFDLDVCPRNVKAGSLDIWVANLIFALLPKIDSENESIVNCLIGRFRLENGVMVPTTLGMDTTKLRVIAEGQIDLAKETYDLKLTPHPKRPKLFSLEVPVGVVGPLNAPEINMGKLPILRSVGRVTTNTLLFPAKFIFGDRLPEDGSDVCPCAGIERLDGR